ncbi:hypothetical protein [Rhizosphaericola mali]|uniref:Lipoprotein n=1 Tax=Rhizosphaericola mali TaxID=2545455 RepID=A0A5P2GA34_9BACT|nr:hypothetical protein [Rhizosphaericola mali]QES90560.1 hypothetical protein E0W69_018485 [Rhizosphaericola mali]
MKIPGLFKTFIFLCLIFCSCARELSLETNNNKASGYLTSVNVHGDYTLGTNLTDSNYLTVSAMFNSPGNYNIGTDTVYGYWFAASGYISHTGISDFHIPSFGTFLKDANADFIIHFDTSILPFSITPLSAAYVFDAPSGNCPTMEVFGTYKQGVSLATSDSVRIPIIVTRTGKYTIQTSTVNNIQFHDSGSFVHLGKDTLTLYGSGTPATIGTYNIPISVSSTACDISIPVVPKIDMTMYWYFTAEGVVHNGYIPDSLVIGGTANDIEMIGISGKVLPDSTNSEYVYPFTLGFGRIKSDIIPGTYIPSALPYSDFFALFSQSHATTSTTYTATVYLPGFSIQLLEIDKSSGFVRGTFSGPVHKTADANPFFPQEDNSPVVNITEGYFQGYLKKK